LDCIPAVFTAGNFNKRRKAHYIKTSRAVEIEESIAWFYTFVFLDFIPVVSTVGILLKTVCRKAQHIIECLAALK
jgi:hypothetical protein